MWVEAVEVKEGGESMELYKIVGIFFIIMSVVAMALYGIDKAKAKLGAWRIPEKVLLGVGFFGGAAGALIGMKLFHHKTRHWYFWTVNAAGLLIQTAALIYLMKMA